VISELQSALKDALQGKSQIDSELLEADGLSGKGYRRFLNNLIRNIPDPRYLEVGVWTGSTLCSAANRNKLRAVGIDNWSQHWERSPAYARTECDRNLRKFVEADVRLIERDFREVPFGAIGKFNVYFFDGPHDTVDQYDGIRLALPALDDEFVMIVDNWNNASVRQGTLEAFKVLRLEMLWNFVVRTTMDDTYAFHPDWADGCFIGVMKKC